MFLGFSLLVEDVNTYMEAGTEKYYISFISLLPAESLLCASPCTRTGGTATEKSSDSSRCGAHRPATARRRQTAARHVLGGPRGRGPVSSEATQIFPKVNKLPLDFTYT